MTTERARELLGIGKDATSEERRAKLDERRSVLEGKRLAAATQGLKLKYEQAIQELEQAYETLEVDDPGSALQHFDLEPKGPTTKPERETKAERPAPGRSRGLSRNTKVAVGAALAIGALALAWPELHSRWTVHQINAQTLAALARGDWRAALGFAYEAKEARPGDSEYNDTYTRSLNALIDYERKKLPSASPVDALAEVDDLATNLHTQMGTDGMSQLRNLFEPLEQDVINESGKAFDVDLPAINKVTGYLSADLEEVFSAESRPAIKQLVAAGKYLGDAQRAWDNGNPGDTARSLSQVPQNLQRKVYSDLKGKVDGVLAEINGKVKQANLLARGGDYMGARKVFEALMPQESWIGGLKEAREQATASGEDYYHMKLLEAVASKQPAEAAGWFKKLREFQSQSVDGIDISSLFAPQTTAQFLSALVPLNLHPATEDARRDYGDVQLVAADEANLTDASEADQFLAEHYLQWASTEAKKGHLEQACYLALLAKKHGSGSADEPFSRWQAALVAKCPIELDIETLKTTPAKARDFSDALFSSNLQMLRNSVPSFIRVSDPDNPLEDVPGSVKLKLAMGVSEFSSKQESVQRNESSVVKVNVMVHNPDFDTAQAAVDAATQAVNAENENIRQTSQVQAMTPDYGGMAGALAGVINQTTQGVQSDNLAELQNTLNDAQQTLSRTPQQIQQVQDKTITWQETDHLARFHSIYRVDLKFGDLEPIELPFEATEDYKATERKGVPEFGVEPIEREDPDMDQITAALSKKVSAQLERYFSQTFRSNLKHALADYIISESKAEDPVVPPLRGALLWWDTPMRSLPRAMEGSLRAHFGDTVTVDTPSSRGALAITSTPPGAEVTIGSESKGLTPLSLNDIPTGIYKIGISAEGYKDVVRDVEVNQNDLAELSVVLPRGEGDSDATRVIALARRYLGPKSALNAIKSVHYSGNIVVSYPNDPSRGKTHMSVDIIAEKPLRGRTVFGLAKGRVTDITDGNDAWETKEYFDDPAKNASRSLPESRLKELRANVSEDLYYYQDSDGAAGVPTYKGVATEDGIECERVDFTHDQTVVYQRYFEKDTGRLVLTIADGASIRESGEIVVGGIRFPEAITEELKDASGADEWATTMIDQVVLNESFGPEMFVATGAAPKPPNATTAVHADLGISGPNGAIHAFEASNLDQIPQPLYQSRPAYPLDLRSAGISGEVLVDFIVDSHGVVRNAAAVRSSQKGFESAAVDAVNTWRFKPGMKGGNAVDTHMQVPIVFALNPDS